MFVFSACVCLSLYRNHDAFPSATWKKENIESNQLHAKGHSESTNKTTNWWVVKTASVYVAKNSCSPHLGFGLAKR